MHASQPHSTEPTTGNDPRHLSNPEFRQALQEIAPHLRAFAYALSGSLDQADDLAQETLLKAWAARDRYRAGTNFKAWTFTILRNHFYSEIRRRRFQAQYDEATAEGLLMTPPSQESAIELSDILRALSTLPDIYREVVILVVAGNLSYDEIADICGIAQGTVKSRLCRARAKLSQIVESGHLPDCRRNFMLTSDTIQAFFAECARIANGNTPNNLAA